MCTEYVPLDVRTSPLSTPRRKLSGITVRNIIFSSSLAHPQSSELSHKKAQKPKATIMNRQVESCIIIIKPHPHDVLCGRGAGVTKNTGNKCWHDLIASNRHLYTSVPRNQRPAICQNIVQAVRSLSPPGRFLAKDKNGVWYDIGDEKAQEKTAQAMRDSKKQNKMSALTLQSLSLGRGRAPKVEDSQDPQNLSRCNMPTNTAIKAAECSSDLVKPKLGRNTAIGEITCSPEIVKPKLGRIGTDDTFAKRIQALDFGKPFEQEYTFDSMRSMDTTIVSRDSSGSSTLTKYMEELDTVVEQCMQKDVPIPTAPLKRSFESRLSISSVCTFTAESIEQLEASLQDCSDMEIDLDFLLQADLPGGDAVMMDTSLAVPSIHTIESWKCSSSNDDPKYSLLRSRQLHFFEQNIQGQ
jgi:hypothetical protein